MIAWELTATFNLVVAVAYILISMTIVRGLVRTGQLRANRLAVATACIFLTCAMHHGHHGLALVFSDGSGIQAGLRAASGGWYGVSIDAITAVVGVVYLALRHSYGILLRSPAMFDVVGQAHYRQLAANLPHTAVFVFDSDQRILLADGEILPGSTPAIGRPEGRLMSEALTTESRGVFAEPLRAALEGGSSDFDHVSPSGEQTYRDRARPVFDEKGAVVGGLLLVEDVTEERAAAAKLDRAYAFNEAVLNASPDITTITDLSTGATTWSSRSVQEMLGWTAPRSGLTNLPDLQSLVAEEDRPRLTAADNAVRELADGESCSVRFRLRSPDDDYRWVSRRTTPFGRNSHGVVEQGLSLIREITDVMESEQRLEHAALHDPLTGLPNRILLMDRVTSAIDRSDRDDLEIAVLFCDIDGFKRVNDTAGHGAGDAILAEVAHRLSGVLRKSDSIGRVGGDEFVIVLEPRRSAGRPRRSPETPPPHPGTESESDVDRDLLGAREVAELVVARLRNAIAKPIVYQGVEFVVSLSIGMSLAGPGSVAEEVIRDADAAMYLAKQRGKDRLEVFDEEMRSDTAERAHVELALRAAFRPGGPSRSELTVAYQPILDLCTGNLFGFEALARLTDNEGLSIPPDDFIPIAEETGLITDLGEAVLDAALGGLVRWRAQHLNEVPARMHVNISARQAQRADMPMTVDAALARHGLQPSDLILELTESVLLQAGSSALRQLTELHDTGVGIAIDDFGTGYASLRYLATLPVSSVKVDKTFTNAMLTDSISATIVRAIAALAADMGLSCIVEGIETDQQLVALPAGVLGQGYLLGRPSAVPRNDWVGIATGTGPESAESIPPSVRQGEVR